MCLLQIEIVCEQSWWDTTCHLYWFF